MDHFPKSLLFESRAQRLCEERYVLQENCSSTYMGTKIIGDSSSRPQISFVSTYVATLGT